MAAADAVEGGQPPPELSLYWQCTKFHSLPYAGGIQDQPAALMRHISIAGMVYETWRDFIRHGDTEFKYKYPERWEIVKMILKARNG